MLQLQLQEENQLVNGAGSGNDLYGFLHPPFSQSTPTAAKLGSDDYFTAVMKMFTSIRTANGTSGVSGWAEPSGIIIHPTDWQTIITQKDTTGRFIYGDPAADPIGKTIWGVAPAVTAVIAQGTALAGDFVMHSHITRRQGATLQVGFINDDFIKGRSAIKVTERLSLEIYRVKAFYALTGL
jgi:HK97 family phage major capsid protein